MTFSSTILRQTPKLAAAFPQLLTHRLFQGSRIPFTPFEATGTPLPLLSRSLTTFSSRPQIVWPSYEVWKASKLNKDPAQFKTELEEAKQTRYHHFPVGSRMGDQEWVKKLLKHLKTTTPHVIVTATPLSPFRSLTTEQAFSPTQKVLRNMSLHLQSDAVTKQVTRLYINLNERGMIANLSRLISQTSNEVTYDLAPNLLRE